MLLGGRRLGEGELGVCCHWLLSAVLTGGKLLRGEGALAAEGSGLDAAANAAESRLSVAVVGRSGAAAAAKAVAVAIAASVAVHRVCAAERFAAVKAAAPVVPVPETTKVPPAVSVPAVIITTAAAP